MKKNTLLRPISLLLGFSGLFGTGLSQPLRAETSIIPTQIQVLLPEDSESTSANQSFLLTAKVFPLPQYDGLPTGTVEFFDGPKSLGAAELVAVDGIATATIDQTFGSGIHLVIARYKGDGTYAQSTSAPPSKPIMVEP